MPLTCGEENANTILFNRRLTAITIDVPLGCG